MPANSLKKIWELAFLFVIIASLSLYVHHRRLEEGMRGDRIFTASENLENLNKIQIETPSQTINLYDDEGIWRVEEADNYYADFQKINALIQGATSIRLGAKTTQKPQQELIWTTVKLFSKDKMLGEAQISNAEHKGTHYIRYPNKKEIYMSGWKMQLPGTLMSWTYQPLLRIKGTDVMSMEKEKIALTRNTEGAVFYNSETKLPYNRFEYMQVFDIISDLRYENVLSSQEFDENRYSTVRSIKITTFDGMVATLRVHTDFHEYWVELDLSTTSLPTVEVDAYVKENKFLYKDWWFKLSEETGRTLFMTKF